MKCSRRQPYRLDLDCWQFGRCRRTVIGVSSSPAQPFPKSPPNLPRHPANVPLSLPSSVPARTDDGRDELDLLKYKDLSEHAPKTGAPDQETSPRYPLLAINGYGNALQALLAFKA